jgi:hypothetical protein
MLVWDSDELVSQTSIRALLERDNNIGFKVMADLINDDRFATLSESSQERFIVTFSRLGGEYAVGYLNKLISGWSFVQTQAQNFYQQVAFRALSQNRSQKAEEALLKLSRSWRKRIRKMANAALNERREIIYGDD